MNEQEKKMLLNTQARLLELEKRVEDLERMIQVSSFGLAVPPRIGRDESWPQLNLEIEEAK